MKRVLLVLAALAALLTAFAAPAQATTDFSNAPSGAHYANGSGEPVCTFTTSTATLSCTGTEIAGVGNTNATLSATVASSFTGVCHNPGNDNVVDPFTDSDSSSVTQPLFPSRNGRLAVPPVTVNGTSTSEFLATFSCPNPNWRPEVTDASITWSYSVTFDGFTAPVILITS